MPLTGEEIANFCEAAGFNMLSLTDKHALAVKNLRRRENTPPHNDPFDRIMLSQAIVEKMMFMTQVVRVFSSPEITISCVLFSAFKYMESDCCRALKRQ